MPVKEHWDQWSGSADLIVATALCDHEIPVAYDTRGRRTGDSTFAAAARVHRQHCRPDAGSAVRDVHVVSECRERPR